MELAISLVVPVFNEEGNAAPLAREIAAALAGQAFEIIFVDDASTDATLASLEALRGELPGLRLLHHQHRAGQSRALRTGALAARAPVLAFLDGDGQNDPADLPRLLERMETEHVAMVAGVRAQRQDRLGKRLGSRIGNALRRALLRDGAEDGGCGLKVIRREAYLRLPFFDHQHRYLPALMARDGLKVAYAPVTHRRRAYGRAKYTNLGRLVLAVTDIFGLLWLQSRARDPGEVDER